MASFVLIGGAWHGAWCWKLVAPLLRAAGHEAYPLSLTGLGERKHLFTTEVGLGTHIQDVVSFMFYEDLNDVILVGHSYAGMVITGAAGQVPERVSGLIYFDSYVPGSGEALHTIGGKAPTRSEPPPGGMSPPPPGVAERLGINDPTLVAWTEARLVPHPYRAFIEPVKYDQPTFDAIPRAFIACKDKPNPGTSAPFAAMAKADPTWHYRELRAGHDAMLTVPRETTDALIGLARALPGAPE